MCQTKMQATALPQHSSFASFSSQHPHKQIDGYQTSTTNWRINTGFKKLQKRINERHKSGRSNSSHAIQNRSLPPISGDTSGRKKKHASISARNNKTDNLDNSILNKTGLSNTSRTAVRPKKDGPSEFSVSLQYELYRTSNNGLTRISARMQKNKFRRPSQTTLDFSDSSSFLNEEEMCSPPQQTTTTTTATTQQQKLPDIEKSRLLKQDVQRMDKQHEKYFDEELEDRIVRWIKQCKMFDCYDGSPYDDLDVKLRKKQRYLSPNYSSHNVSKHESSVLDRSNTCL